MNSPKLHVVLLTILLIASLALGYASSFSAEGNVWLETYKIVLGFTLVGVLGVALKSLIDAQNEKQKEHARRYDEWESTRAEIITEMSAIFSGFYSIRKLYHSARSTKNALYQRPSDKYTALLHSCLERATNLEGRYGALKILIIRHFGLPSGDFGYRSIETLAAEREASSCEKNKLRCTLDILGEAYDDWRHALEEDRKIDVNESWEAYESLLGFLNKQSFPKPSDGTPRAADAESEDCGEAVARS